MVKFLFWMVLFSTLIWNGYLIFRAHYNNWQAEDVFALLVESRATASEPEVRTQMKKLFQLKYITRNDFPDAFFENLSIQATGSAVEISSIYQVTVWPLGSVKARDADGTYHPDDLNGLDIVRDKLRIDIEFEPYAITGMDRQ